MRRSNAAIIPPSFLHLMRPMKHFRSYHTSSNPSRGKDPRSSRSTRGNEEMRRWEDEKDEQKSTEKAEEHPEAPGVAISSSHLLTPSSPLPHCCLSFAALPTKSSAPTLTKKRTHECSTPHTHNRSGNKSSSRSRSRESDLRGKWGCRTDKSKRRTGP